MDEEMNARRTTPQFLRCMVSSGQLDLRVIQQSQLRSHFPATWCRSEKDIFRISLTRRVRPSDSGSSRPAATNNATYTDPSSPSKHISSQYINCASFHIDFPRKKTQTQTHNSPTMFGSLSSLQPRQLATQVLNFALVLSTAFMLWKGLSVATDSASPIVVVLSGSMEPAFQRGDLLFLWNRGLETKVGEVVVYNVRGKDIPIVHRVVRRFGGGEG